MKMLTIDSNMKTENFTNDHEMIKYYKELGFIPYRLFKREDKFLEKEEAIYLDEKEINQIFNLFGNVQEGCRARSLNLEYDENLVEMMESINKPGKEIIYLRLDITPYIKPIK